MMKRIKNVNTNKFDLKRWKVYILGGLCGIMAVVSIFLTIETATSGAEMASLQKQEDQILTKQQDLQEGLVEGLSVSSLQEKSTEMGFTKVNNLVYVANSVPVARLPGVEVNH